MAPKFQVQLKIRRPVAEVFEAVVNPDRLKGYFVKSSTGRLEQGQTVKWSFSEAPQPFDIHVDKVVKDERIEFRWPTLDANALTRVEMVFRELRPCATMVQISESGWADTEAGVKESYGNCGGWMHMMCSMKGYLEYDINLRQGGAFEDDH